MMETHLQQLVDGIYAEIWLMNYSEKINQQENI